MKSFTLIEILTVISLILILTVFVVPNFHLANSKMALERSAYRLAQEFRDAEEMALSSRGTPASFGSTFFPKGGYGLYFQDKAKSYILFADCDNDTAEPTPDHLYDPTGTGSSCKDSGTGQIFPEKVKEIFLESGVMIKKVNPLSLTAVTFFPPDPSVRSIPALPAYPSVVLVSIKDETKGYSVDVNQVGRIEIRVYP